LPVGSPARAADPHPRPGQLRLYRPDLQAGPGWHGEGRRQSHVHRAVL